VAVLGLDLYYIYFDLFEFTTGLFVSKLTYKVLSGTLNTAVAFLFVTSVLFLCSLMLFTVGINIFAVVV